MAKLYFYYSAMNAGKTTTLLQSAHNYHERGMRTLILTPRLDDRYGEGVVASRIGLKARGLIFGPGDDLHAMVAASIERDGALHCVLVDESQFLSKLQVWQLTEIVDRLNVPVLAYGLRTDFRGELFEGSSELLAIADNLREIRTICHCGRKATMVVRRSADGRTLTSGDQVGIEKSMYVSLCRRHWDDEMGRSAAATPSAQATKPRAVKAKAPVKKAAKKPAKKTRANAAPLKLAAAARARPPRRTKR